MKSAPVYLLSVMVILGSIVFGRSKGLIGNIHNEYGEGKFYSSEYENGSGTEDNGIASLPGKLFFILLLVSGVMKAFRMGEHRHKIEKVLFLSFGTLSLILMYGVVLETSSPYRTLVEDKNIGLILMTVSILLGTFSIIGTRVSVLGPPPLPPVWVDTTS